MEGLEKKWDEIASIKMTYGEMFTTSGVLTLFCAREVARVAAVLPSHLSFGRRLIETLLEAFGAAEFPPAVREAWEMFLKSDGCGEGKH